MKKQLAKLLLLCMSIAVISTTIISCKAKDADVKVAAETALSANTALQGITVTVTDGVATLAGEVKDEATKAAAEAAVTGVKGVKSVANNITIAAPPAPPVVQTVTVSPDEALTKGLTDVLKDFPSVKSSVSDGVVTLTGEIAKPKWVVLKQAIDKMTPKGYDLKGLKIK